MTVCIRESDRMCVCFLLVEFLSSVNTKPRLNLVKLYSALSERKEKQVDHQAVSLA